MLRIIAPQNGQIVSVQTKEQLEFLQMDRRTIETTNYHWLDIKRQDTPDFTFPNWIQVTWEPQVPAVLQVAEQADFSDAFSVSGVGSCEITNLKVGTRYFLRVVADTQCSEISYIDTADVCPRFLWVEGTTNVRDCGGWKTENGRRIRQGLLYRGSEMNSHVTVTPAGMDTLRNQLKLKSVLDVRGSSEEVENAYGGNYINVPCSGYVEYLNQPEVQRKIFEFLTVEENYPVYFHCWGGADRTATIAFILGAVLGMNEKDLLDDYEITTLSIWGGRSRTTALYRGFAERFEQIEGQTLQQKAENFLHSCGITDEQIQRFRNIMLVDENRG